MTLAEMAAAFRRDGGPIEELLGVLQIMLVTKLMRPPSEQELCRESVTWIDAFGQPTERSLDAFADKMRAVYVKDIPVEILEMAMENLE